MAIEAFACFDPSPNSALYVAARRRELRPLKSPPRRKYRDMLK